MGLSEQTTVKELFLRSCKKNDVSAARYFLSLGADVNWKGVWAGLHWAARDNFRELLELLLTQTGVDVNITNDCQQTPLMLACSNGHENIVRRLIRMPDIQYHIKDVFGKAALHWAVLENKPRSVEVLRGVGASVDWNVRSSYGDYPLTLAVHYGYPAILQTILSVPELDLSVMDQDGRDVAQIAVEGNMGDRQRVVEILSKDRRVNWNIRNSDGDTPLMYCLKNNKIEMAQGQSQSCG